MIERTLKVSELFPHELKEAEFETLTFDYLTAAIYKTQRVSRLIVNIREDGRQVVLSGHHRLKAMKTLGIEDAPCEVYEGLSKERELEYFYLDNVRGQKIKDGDKQLEIALKILELMPDASNKEKMAEFSKKTGVSMSSAEKSVAAARKIKATIDASEDKESATQEAMTQAKKGLRSKKTTAKTVPEKLPVTAKVQSCPHCKELESKVSELEKFKAKAEMQTRRHSFLLDSFGDNEVWRNVLRYMDQKINLSVFNKHISAPKPPEDQRLRLEVWKPDLEESILHDYFFLYYNGQPIEKTGYVDVVEEEPDEDVLQDDQEEYAQEEVVEF